MWGTRWKFLKKELLRSGSRRSPKVSVGLIVEITSPGISNCEVGEITEAAARPASTAKEAEDYFCMSTQEASEIGQQAFRFETRDGESSAPDDYVSEG